MLWQVAWLSATGWVLLVLLEHYCCCGWVGIAGGALLLLVLWRLLLWRTTAAADGDYWPDTAEETRSGGLRGNTSVGGLRFTLKGNTLLSTGNYEAQYSGPKFAV